MERIARREPQKKSAALLSAADFFCARSGSPKSNKNKTLAIKICFEDAIRKKNIKKILLLNPERLAPRI
jgi:hypothetical protein